MFLRAILFLGAPIPRVMFGRNGAIIFLGDHHIKEVTPPFLIYLWGTIWYFWSEYAIELKPKYIFQHSISFLFTLKLPNLSQLTNDPI